MMEAFPVQRCVGRRKCVADVFPPFSGYMIVGTKGLFGISLGHVRDMFVTRLGHVCVMFGTCLRYIYDICTT